jgi:hypothetical protein
LEDIGMKVKSSKKTPEEESDELFKASSDRGVCFFNS